MKTSSNQDLIPYLMLSYFCISLFRSKTSPCSRRIRCSKRIGADVTILATLGLLLRSVLFNLLSNYFLKQPGLECNL